jgi:hypothetical protein
LGAWLLVRAATSHPVNVVKYLEGKKVIYERTMDQDSKRALDSQNRDE